ncbi:hypothetical protein [Micromonospora sp. NPDC092111]|uniref:biotin synthase auxiliary protein BsaP n=1 Tax=Micromonospora sp. NPDC092111 TaxID=3364289 RepID=UPI003811ACAF
MTTPDPGAAGRTATAGPRPAATGPAWCDRCGEPADPGDHPACRAAREWEPPRFCGHCRRRMKVQVVPAGWVARCVEHGELRG